MYFLGIGVLLLILKAADLTLVAGWDWWFVLSPFALAVLWWAWADWSGYTKKKTMDKENARRKERIDKTREALGTDTKKRR